MILEKVFELKLFKELEGVIVVKGGGGGYLFNEILYCSICFCDEFNLDIFIGYIYILCI